MKRLRPSVFTPTITSTTVHIPDRPSMPVTLVTLVTMLYPYHSAGEFYCLQALRHHPKLLRGERLRLRCRRYCENVDGFAAQLVFAAGVDACDALLGVPTRRRRLQRPYLAAARAGQPGIVDLTTLVRRDRDAGSESELSFAERQARHELTGPLSVARRLLFLDDFLASGESAAHVIELIRRHTSPMPEVVLAVPLSVPREDQAANFIRQLRAIVRPGVTSRRARWRPVCHAVAAAGEASFAVLPAGFGGDAGGLYIPSCSWQCLRTS